MTARDNVDRVISLLDGAGYQALVQPIIIGGIPFEATAILAKDKWLELITVIDTVLNSDDDSLCTKIEGLGRALDLVGSRRALTVILVGPRPSQTLDSKLKQVARVLCVPAAILDDNGSAVRDALAVLLPLDLSPASDETVASWPNVRENLRAKFSTKEIEPIFEAVPLGQRRVQTVLHDTLIELLDAQ